jgi:CRISPR-associated protein Cas1
MDLIVDQFGAYLGKHSERLQVTKGKEKLAEAPLLNLDTVLVTGRGISLSADAIELCAERGIPIHFVTTTGRPYASLYAAGLTGTIQTRRAQLAAYHDGRGLAVAKAFATGKIENQASLLRYMARYRKERDPALYKEVRLVATEIRDHLEEIRRLDGGSVDEVRFELLSAEGRAAQRYWAALEKLLLVEVGWTGRETRGATDVVNSALNYGYGIVYTAVERALVLAGLDPYAGFLHVDRPGKPSLVLDVIEEFRQAAVDRTVFGLLNKRVMLELDEAGRLTDASRRTLAEKVLERLNSDERYAGKRYPLKAVIQMQARHLATFLRGDREEYAPFLARW